jgi:hypothetical protein
MSSAVARGRLIAIGIAVLAVAATAAALAYRRSRVARPLAFWGAEAAHLVAYAPRVELLRLEPATGEDADVVRYASGEWRIAHRRDATQARGLIHIRHALLDTAAYRWERSGAAAAPPQWQFALRFSEEEQEAVVLLDFDTPRWQQADWQPQAALAGGDRAADIAPAAAGLREFIDAEMPPENSGVQR